MNSGDVMRWVGGYERAWREGDREAVAALFSDDASYRVLSGPQLDSMTTAAVLATSA